MNASVFISMSDRKMALLINGAKRRVIVAIPAVRQETASALQNAAIRLGYQNIGVVIDCDEEVFRLGYGDLKAVKSLRESGCRIRQSSGLRIGVLVCDDQAWVFAPTALYVQEEVHSDETPNGVALRASDVERIVSRILPGQPPINENVPVPDEIREELSKATIEIGQEEIPKQLLEQTEKALEQAPPVAFNVARQVRVFEPYIQYVEISLRGCAIERHRIEIPKSIQGIAPNADLELRLRTTFELIQKNSEVSSEPLENELDTIRDDFTRALGKPWGRVLLRNIRPTFDQRIRKLKERLAMHKKAVEESLGKHLEDSRKQLVDYFFPLIQKNTPDALRGQITTSKPNDDQIRAWLDAELCHAFPKPDDLIKGMTLDVQFRDVTFETLNEPGFAEKLKDEYEHVDWEKPFTEFKAARGRDSAKSNGNEE
jgi:hypothetical protein